nr:hypothetical protein [Amycolatopsis rhizosphaerae]
MAASPTMAVSRRPSLSRFWHVGRSRGDDPLGVVAGLEQAGNDLAFVSAYPRGVGFQFDEHLDGFGQDVAVVLPPARFIGLAAQRLQLGGRVGGNAQHVHGAGEHVRGHLGLARLDLRPSRLVDANLGGQIGARQTALLSVGAQLAAETAAAHGRPHRLSSTSSRSMITAATAGDMHDHPFELLPC